MLDVDDPVAIGAMVGPEAFTEVRYLSHYQLSQALTVFPEVCHGWGRRLSTVDAYRVDGADTVVVTLGSVSGTLKDVADEFGNVGVLTITMFRPFPYAEVRKALGAARRVVVLERALAPGARGIVSADVHAALSGSLAEVSTVVAGSVAARSPGPRCAGWSPTRCRAGWANGWSSSTCTTSWSSSRSTGCGSGAPQVRADR